MAKSEANFGRLGLICRSVTFRTRLKLGLKPSYYIAKGSLKGGTVANGRDRREVIFSAKFGPLHRKEPFLPYEN